MATGKENQPDQTQGQRVALVFPPFYHPSMYNLPPLGLINLATALKQGGHQVRLHDFVLGIRDGSLGMDSRIYETCAARILKGFPQVVGLSAQCTTYPGVVQIARHIKTRDPGVRVVVGGHNAGFVDERTLARYPFIDAVVRGEGEETFPDLVSHYALGGSGEGVRGVTCRAGGRIVRNPDRPLIADLDLLPLPDYSVVPSFEAYRDACHLPRSIAILEVGRGCPHHCVYCSESIMWRRRTRTFSVARLVGEMAHLHREQGAECFLLAYDQFTARREFVTDFCHRVIEEGLQEVPWYCISRLDTVDAALLSLMREAGCESMCYGIDSGSRRTLAFIRKRIDRSLLYRRVRETAENGLVPTLSFVIGFPEEERQDINQTLRLALQCGILGNNNPLIQMPTVLPGTDLYKGFKDRLVRRVDTYFSLGLEFDGGKRLASDESLIREDPELYSAFYNVEGAAVPLEDLNLIASYFPLVVRYYPKSFLLLATACNRSLSDLFLDWLGWVGERKQEVPLSLSPRDCYTFFGPFTRELHERQGAGKIPHLPAVLRYETLALEVARTPLTRTPFHMDVHAVEGWRPRRREAFVVETFAFDLPGIILDLREEKLKPSYPLKETILLFRQEGDQLEVDEINAFGRDLLALCDGSRTLEAVMRSLFSKHGQGMAWEAFSLECLEAVQTLGRMGLLKALGSDLPPGKEVKKDAEG